MKNYQACLLLLFAAAVWGSGFSITKGTLDVLPPNTVLMLRFGIASLVMSPLLWKARHGTPKKTWWIGALVGVLIFLGHMFQTIGLQSTTVGKSAFLSAVYVVLVPFLVWVAGKRIPTAWNVLAAFICLAGIGVIALDGNLTVGVGDTLTLIGGICFALQIAVVNLYAQECNVVVLTWIMMVVSTVCAAVAAFGLEPSLVHISLPTLAALMYLAVFCSVLAFAGQNLGIKYANPALATLIMSMESVFGCLAGVLFLGETVGMRMLLGCAMIAVSLLITNVCAG